MTFARASLHAGLGAALATLALDARAGGGAATDAYDGIAEGRAVDVHGLVDAYVQHDFDRPSSGVTAYRPFDLATDAPSLGLARVTLAHRPGPFGFRVDGGMGDLANEYLRSDPARAEHPELARALSYAEQAFVTAVVPVGRGLAIDVGKFGTPIGLEDNESPATWCYSRSLLYTLAEPTYHAGVRATYVVSDALAVSAFVANGWNTNVLAGNGMRGFAVAATWSPAPAVQIMAVDMAGPERAPARLGDPTLTFRNELDVSAVVRLGDRVSLAFTGDHGHDDGDGGVTWWGLGGYARAQPLSWLAATVRGERFADPDGYASGLPQRIAEITATLEARAAVGDVQVATRVEYRRDQSDARAFETDGPRPSTRRDTAALAVIAWF